MDVSGYCPKIHETFYLLMCRIFIDIISFSEFIFRRMINIMMFA